LEIYSNKRNSFVEENLPTTCIKKSAKSSASTTTTMDMWRANNSDIVCHNRLRAVSLNEDDIAFNKMNGAGSDSDFSSSNQSSLNNSFENENTGNSSFSFKSYIAANEPVNMKLERDGRNKEDGTDARHMNLSWKERQNDYSFMKR